MTIFGFASSGVSLAGMSLEALLAPVPLGIAAGLFLGKQAGVFLTTSAVVRLDWADCPEDASFAQVYGFSLLCGIGFTMSLFIALLAFPGAPICRTQSRSGCSQDQFFVVLLALWF